MSIYTTINLNGQWELINGPHRANVQVPGLATDPKVINPDPLRFVKELHLPDGNWTHCTLILKGARFCPKIFINDTLVAEAEGGMAPIYLPLHHQLLSPNNTVELVIELMPINLMEETDASRIPEADFWRSNVSCCLWDDIVLECHGSHYIERCIPHYHLESHTLDINWQLNKNSEGTPNTLKAEIRDLSNNLVLSEEFHIEDYRGTINLKLTDAMHLWSPDSPHCYTLGLSILEPKIHECSHSKEMLLGLKDFHTTAHGFVLNNEPIKLRAASVVWHRLLRDDEAKYLAFDEKWFEMNVVQRLKNQGANTLRFHLGMPPESLLRLCDKYGLLAQAEWCFFHGLKASKESLFIQWRHWIDYCLCHPSTAIIHAWNETSDKELRVAYEVLDKLLEEYPPLVIGHKDVIHIHKYWWSLFENIGLYYDSSEEFPLPIMVDEFGGNYLDGKGNPGKYPMVEGAFQRFLGKSHTKEERLELNSLSNVKIAEYWRRIDAAGYSPFCLLGSPEDGNHQFFEPLKDGHVKPVVDDLAVIYSPISCSMDLWNKNFSPGEKITFPLHLFNDTNEAASINVSCKIVSGLGAIEEEIYLTKVLSPFSHEIETIELTLPVIEGNWIIQAQVMNPPSYITSDIISSWKVSTLLPMVPAILKNKVIATLPWDQEIIDFLEHYGLPHVDFHTQSCDILITGRETWNRLKATPYLEKKIRDSLHTGSSALMLEIGPNELYLPGCESALASLYQPKAYKKESMELFTDIQLTFSQVAEPESCFHSTQTSLLNHLTSSHTQLWNGYRGGLVLPTWDMVVQVPSRQGFLKYWKEKGADLESIQSDSYYAYELGGSYLFTNKVNDRACLQELRKRVRFLVEDAPSLRVSLDPEGAITKYHLSEMYKKVPKGSTISDQIPLALSGKSLVRTPVVKINYNNQNNCLVLSQLLTDKRLSSKFVCNEPYALKEDPAAQQYVLNLLEELLK